MITGHLTDEELQLIATESMDMSAAAKSHLSGCSRCQARVYDYRLLASSIQQEPSPVFDFDLVAAVMPQLPSSQPAFLPDRFLTYLLVCLGIVVGGAALYLLGNDVLTLFSSMAPLGMALGMATLACLAALVSLDMYSNYKKKMNLLDFS